MVDEAEATYTKTGNNTEGGDKAAESKAGPTQKYVVDLQDNSMSRGLGGVQVGTVSWIARHFAVRHRRVPIMYRCCRCGRTNPSHHSVACHIPKCKGVNVATGGGDHAFRCDHCEACFATGRGLSAHQWRVHNQASKSRMAAARAVARTGTAVKRTADKGDTWSDSEDFATGDRRFRAPVRIDSLEIV